jgi:hypothetical protein
VIEEGNKGRMREKRRQKEKSKCRKEGINKERQDKEIQNGRGADIKR